MDKCRMVFAGFLGIFVCISGIGWAEEIVWEDTGANIKGATAILVDTDTIYIGTENGSIVISDDGGINWRQVLRVKGEKSRVNSLSFGTSGNSLIYAATGNGLYLSSDSGINWKRIFKGRGGLDSECTSLAVLPEIIYLGTRSGLWVSKDLGNSWVKASGELGNLEIISIDSNGKDNSGVYVLAVRGVYKIENGIEKIVRVFMGISLNQTQEDAGEEDEEGIESRLLSIALDKSMPGCVYLGTSRGIYQSKDNAATWEKLSGYGLLNDDIDYIFVSEDSGLYVVTSSGIFKYAAERWRELSFGLSSLRVNRIFLDSYGRLYAASDKGLFRGVFKNSMMKQSGAWQSYSEGEPSIKEVREAAIEYAEVSPKKISNWRRQAAQKAWLPQLSMGVNKNSTDLWHWEGGSTTKTEDDILRRGKSSVDWDVTLSWDLSEIIWNDDQTSIDVRSKLMVQLREDIIDEVTKTYFERLRVKAELDALKIEDKRKRFEKELKLEELTSLLDGMTGGYFSRNL